MYKLDISYRFRNCYIVVSRILTIYYDISPSNCSIHLSEQALLYVCQKYKQPTAKSQMNSNKKKGCRFAALSMFPQLNNVGRNSIYFSIGAPTMLPHSVQEPS